MAFEESGGMGTTMLVSPSGVAGGNGFGNGFGGDWAWIILLLLLGWGNNGFGGGYGGAEIYPWMNQANLTSNGFQNQLMNDNITSIRDGVQGISTQLCNGFAGVEQGANARQIANMQTAFDAQTAMMQGFNGVQGQLAQCCCDNRLATCQTQNIVQNEGNATRFADANNTRDIIDSQTRGTQAILDKLCSLELDAKNDTIAQLRSELLYARGQASQDVQTSVLRQSEVQTANQLVQELRSCPIPSMPVYGQTPIFTCSQNHYGCGCNGGI